MKKIIVGMFLLIGIGCFSLYKPKDEEQVLREEAINLSNLVGVYIQNGDSYTKSDTIPESGYEFNQEESYCKIGDNRQDHITLNYNPDTKELSVTPLSSKDTKCYLYFDEKAIPAKDVILAGKDIQTRDDFSTIVSGDTTGIIYQANDGDGTTYYFAGNPTDNWVNFAGFYWRIIRINGDGTIRMIYNGTSTATTGTGTQISLNGSTTTYVFNSSRDRSEYVGLKYTQGEQYGNTTDSSIMGTLNTWYSSNLTSYASYIDRNAGFCGDRNMASGSSWSSQPSSTIYYAAYGRLNTNKTPSLECSSSDLFTVTGASKGNASLTNPIGLIMADEVAYAGGVNGTNNTGYYLYTNRAYWTMSPYYFYPSGAYPAYVFIVSSAGNLSNTYVSNTFGVRPVINLRADVQLSGSGTSSDPYVVD